jgi:hyperosmotically inducible protein
MKGVALGILLLAPAAAAAQATAQQSAVGRVVVSDAAADQQVKTRVEQRLSERRVRGIKVAAQGGSVTLTGSIASAGAKQDLIADVLKVDGVKEIVSELTIGKAESDQKLAERIADQMRRSSYFTVFDDVEIGVDNGVVTLTGFVTQPIKSDDLARRASHVDGVQEFVNKLEVLPASLADDRLRSVIANTLYRDPTFSNYASQAIPPIHIIVRNSSVLLTGIVNSEVERRQAENIVRGISGIIGVQNALRVER